MITIDSLTKKYGSHTVVHDISFTARNGRVTGFLGPNGAGKSTSMRMMVGLTAPTEGTATISGRRFADLPNPGREVGVMLDASAQHAGRTGREILTIAQQIMGVPASRVAEMLDLVSLSGTEADRRVGNYSLGMRQRLGIAAALIGDPPVLILDEPANGLDPAGIRWMRDLLRDHADRGGTVLLSSHLLAEIEIIADDIVMIGQGRIVSQGPKAELLAAAGTVVRAADVVALQRALAAAGSHVDRLRGRIAPHRCRDRPGRTRGVRRRCGAHRAPQRRQWRTRGDVPRAHRRHPTRPPGGQRHDRHHHRLSRSCVRTGRRSEFAPIPLSRVVRVELRKMFDTRSGFWLIASIAITATIATIATVAFAPEKDLTYYNFAKAVGFPITVILPMIALLSITSEWSQRSGLTTFTYVPSRRRVVWAKTLSSVTVAVASMLFAFVIGAVGNLVGSTIAGAPTVWDLSVGHALTIVLGNLISLSIGTMLGMLLRSSAGGLVMYFVLVLLVPNLSGLLAANQEWYRSCSRGWTSPTRRPTCSRGCTPAPSGHTSPPP